MMSTYSSAWILAVPVAVILLTAVSLQLKDSWYPTIDLICNKAARKSTQKHKTANKKKPKKSKTSRSSPQMTLSNAPKAIPVRILYGTQTGTSKSMALDLEKRLFACNVSGFHFQPQVINIKDYDQDHLEHETVVVYILSTWTGGLAPKDAETFCCWLKDMALDFRVSKTWLSHISHAVFGLGSAEYDEHYCTAAKELSTHLQLLGSSNLVEMGFGDDNVDQMQQFEQWSDQLILKLCSQSTLSPASDEGEAINGGVDGDQTKSWLSQNHHRRQKRNEKQQEALKLNPQEMAWTEEDLMNDRLLTDDTLEINRDVSPTKQPSKAEDDILDVEDIGSSMRESQMANESQEMVTPMQRKALAKEGYKIIGSHSAVKLCRWTKHQLRGRGGCYKHTFYGITSYQCMETTPSLACANKCVFCWRHHKNPVGRVWRWKTDEPEDLIVGSIERHQNMIKELRGLPGLHLDRWKEAFTVRHCALSLVGEPIMYPHINAFCRKLHERRISTFLVTNAQFPEKIAALEPITQLYVSVDAATKDALQAVDRPLFKDFWERFLACLKELRRKGQRTVYRLTLVKSYNMQDIEKYAELIEIGQPDFIEVKAVTYCGKSDGSDLTMKHVPWHEEVVDFCSALVEKTNGIYGLAAQHAHSNCVLLAKKTFYIDEQWHTWIDYEKFHDLMDRYYTDGTLFSSSEYISLTPSWATFDAPEKGFDPCETRFYRTKNGKIAETSYQSTESGCG
uniref:tRNA 4-demethylwyosine synthase (AdoMet-dependent) n=1 Tax=Albugo laibachii Nc14 TaxID=890382 RepID=F0VZB1_9STRA|nr:tRNA wybutosinesynthesizing protein putative [Albugo laibachii Nc14]|eukprot:CCA14141.1 tRNA wybutosinesynthesizing protein putative [Albugo laibachii Nc14]